MDCSAATAFIIYEFRLSILSLFVLFFGVGFFCSGYGGCHATLTATMLIISSVPIQQMLIGWVCESSSFGIAKTTLFNYKFAMSILTLNYLIKFLAVFFTKPSQVEQGVSYEQR